MSPALICSPRCGIPICVNSLPMATLLTTHRENSGHSKLLPLGQLPKIHKEQISVPDLFQKQTTKKPLHNAWKKKQTKNSFKEKPTAILVLKDIIYFQREGKGRKKERNINVWLLLTHPLLETWPTTQACTLTGNLTCNPQVHRPMVNPLSHTSQGPTPILKGSSSRRQKT